MPTRTSEYLGIVICAIAATAPLIYFFGPHENPQRLGALLASLIFGMPALIGLAGILIGPQRMELARRWLSPLLVGIWFLTFGGILLFGGLFQADKLSGGLPFLPADINKSLGSGAFIIVGALIALIGLLAVWSGIERLLEKH